MPTASSSTSPDRAPAPADEPPTEPAPAPVDRPLPDRYLAFERACEASSASIVTIAAVGDVLLHHELQMQAYAAPDRYLNLWSGVVDLFGKADLAYANLESPAAWGITRKGELAPDPGLRFDNKVYSGYARFNVHPSIAEDLVKSGIDVVSTANNHALDRDALGVDRTLDALDKAKLPHTGTRRQGSKEPWHTVTEAKGLRIAWLACTLHTNFGKDLHGQVLHCFKDDTVPKLVRELVDDPNIDAVIVTPHWGKEYATEAGPQQMAFAQQLVDAGATAVIGAHPHVLQPWAKLATADGREAFVMYSLGNFISHQRSLPRATTIVLYLGLSKRDDGSVAVVGARYVPVFVRMEGDKEKFFAEAIDRVGGPADARQLVVDMYGAPNLLPPDEPLDVRPHCRPDWVPAPTGPS